MIVKMKSGAEYLISEVRGTKLKQLLETGTDKPFINLDGNGMMVKTSLIESVYVEKPVSPKTEAWKDAIRANLQTMRQTGHMGRLTAEDIIKSSLATG